MATIEISFKDNERNQLAVYNLPLTPAGPEVEVIINGFSNWSKLPASFSVKLQPGDGDDLVKGRVTALEKKFQRLYDALADYIEREGM